MTMQIEIRNILLITALLFGLGVMPYSAAEDSPMDKADAAVANILFDYEYSEEYASYVVKEDGFVDVTFAKNIPNELYSELVNKLNNHPDINGVLAGTTGAYCARF